MDIWELKIKLIADIKKQTKEVAKKKMETYKLKWKKNKTIEEKEKTLLLEYEYTCAKADLEYSEQFYNLVIDNA